MDLQFANPQRVRIDLKLWERDSFCKFYHVGLGKGLLWESKLPSMGNGSQSHAGFYAIFHQYPTTFPSLSYVGLWEYFPVDLGFDLKTSKFIRCTTGACKWMPIFLFLIFSLEVVNWILMILCVTVMLYFTFCVDLSHTSSIDAEVKIFNFFFHVFKGPSPSVLYCFMSALDLE